MERRPLYWVNPHSHSRPRFVAPTGFTVSRYGNGEATESTNNPYMWNPYLWNSTGTAGVLFTVTDIRKLHQKWADNTSMTNETYLGQLAPSAMARFVASRASAPRPVRT